MGQHMHMLILRAVNIHTRYGGYWFAAALQSLGHVTSVYAKQMPRSQYEEKTSLKLTQKR